MNAQRWSLVAHNFDYPYFAISLSLNVVLTFMIITRIVLRSGNIRGAIGAPARVCGLCETVVTTFVESFALYAINFLLFIVPWSAGSSAMYIFFPILVESQVRFPDLETSPSNHRVE